MLKQTLFENTLVESTLLKNLLLDKASLKNFLLEKALMVYTLVNSMSSNKTSLQKLSAEGMGSIASISFTGISSIAWVKTDANISAVSTVGGINAVSTVAVVVSISETVATVAVAIVSSSAHLVVKTDAVARAGGNAMTLEAERSVHVISSADDFGALNGLLCRGSLDDLSDALDFLDDGSGSLFGGLGSSVLVS